MPLIKRLLLLVGLCLFFQSNAFATVSGVKVNRIEFRLFYPVPEFKNSEVRSVNLLRLGLDLDYQIYLTENFAAVLSPSAWAAPVRKANGDRKTYFTFAGYMGGAINPFPGSYLEPIVAVLGGPSLGHLNKSEFGFPVGTRIGISLYKNQSPFSDRFLSFVVSGSYFRNLHSSSVIEPNYLDVGLGMLGTF